ncbi:hypothetical protein SARC_16383, partial [Sphaeroforma arctica JP610]
VWITNAYEHDGAKVAGDEILAKLLGMVSGHEFFAY